MDKHAVWVTMEAVAGREADAAAFLREVAVRLGEEPGTTEFHAVDLGGGRFGVYSSFLDDDALQAHGTGVGRWIEDMRPGLFAAPYDVTRAEVIAVKP